MSRPAIETETERALAVMAYVVLRHGDAYAPLLDRLEREVEEERRQASHSDRARRILASMSFDASSLVA